MLRTSGFFVVAAFLLAGCKTAEPAAPVIIPMTAIEFDASLSDATADEAPYSGERKLTELVESPRVSPVQRAEALYARGHLRWKKTHDKIGAKADFDEYVQLYPSGAFTNNARYEAGYVDTEIHAAKMRLQTVQTLRDWFDDSWALGKREEAAARYKRSRLTPEPHQIYQLRATGFLCEGTGNSKLHNYGPLTPEIQNLFWCE